MELVKGVKQIGEHILKIYLLIFSVLEIIIQRSFLYLHVAIVKKSTDV